MELAEEKYKQTALGKIPIEWNIYKIQDLIDDGSINSHLDGNHGELYPRSHEFKDSGVPYVGANDFIKGYVDFSNCKFLSEEKASKFRKGIAKDGDVLFAHNATVGPVAFLKTNLDYIILSTTATYFRCDKGKLSNSFLLYALQAPFFVKQYTSVMAQSTRFQVPITAQRKFFLVLPTIEEQTAIATVLSDADALISSLEKLITKKRNIKQGAMQKLLQPKEGWEEKKLGDIFEITAGGDLDTQTFSLIYDEYFCYPVYSNALTNSGLYGYASEYKQVENSITVTARGQVGVAIPRHHKYTAIGRVLMLKPSIDISINYISEHINNFIKFSNESTGVPQLTAPQISKYKISLPQFEEQTKIATVLSDMDNEINALETKLEKYKMLKLGMMQNLLTGKIRLV